LDRKEKAAVVPYSAIIFDTNGKAWIYVEQKGLKDGKHLFERRQVELSAAHQDRVVITRGVGSPALADGELVVVNGAAVLFSREFFKTPLR
jgi:multidrug efflux pump subunit AcrA (membrane-fusion protein)